MMTILKLNKKIIFLNIFFLLSFQSTYQYVFDACELANELIQIHQFSNEQIADWICLIYSESSFRTDSIGPISKLDKSRDYGLFQINSHYWCDDLNKQNLKIDLQKSNLCNENCENFLDDQLSDDIKCALKIYSIHGYKGWQGWKSKCIINNLNISKELFDDNCDSVSTINDTKLIQYIHKSRPYDEQPKLADYNEKREYSNFIYKFKKKRNDEIIKKWINK